MGFKKLSAVLLLTAAIPVAAEISRSPNFHKRAAKNGKAAQVAFQKVDRALKNWATVIDPKTGLIPKGLNRTQLNQWVPEDTAADNYAHLLIASLVLHPHQSDRWTRMIAQERALCGPMPCRINLETGSPMAESEHVTLLGATEYAKDGLLAVVERFGKGPWLDRLIEITGAVMENSHVRTKRGFLPSPYAEINGDLLQILVRVWWITRDDRYWTAAQRIADVYLLDVLPKNNNAVPYSWNFETQKPIDARTVLRDHGNELWVGLSEFCFLAKKENKPQADRYLTLVTSLYRRTAQIGRDKSGVWLEFIDAKTGLPVKATINDNWGYLLNCFATLDLLTPAPMFSSVVQDSVEAVIRARWLNWGWSEYDGFSDSIESMIGLRPLIRAPEETDAWIDGEMKKLYGLQMDNGWIDQNYLEGNFVRTALLYAQMKTAGAMLRPWRADLAFGATGDPADGSLILNLRSESPWTGALTLDPPRHKMFLNLPENYPRLNSQPEWFTVDPDTNYRVATRLETKTVRGTDLIKGISWALPGKKEMNLKITPLKK